MSARSTGNEGRGKGAGPRAGARGRREMIKKARVARIELLWLPCFSDPGEEK